MREHVTTYDGRTCWCLPDCYAPCSECDADVRTGCWRCGGLGAVPCDPANYDGPHALIFVHHDTDYLICRSAREAVS